MSNIIKLKDAIAEYRKANKELDEQLNKAEEHLHQSREEQTELQNRQ